MKRIHLYFALAVLLFTQCSKDPEPGSEDENFTEISKPSFAGRPVNALLVDHNNDLWLGTDSGVYKLRDDKWYLFSMYKNARVTDLQLFEGQVLIGSDSGACMLQPEGIIIDFSGQMVRAFDVGLTDKNWFGVPEGLLMFDGLEWHRNKEITRNLVSISDVRSIAFRETDAFFGTFGKFLYRVDYDHDTDAITGASQMIGGADNAMLNFNGELTTDTIFCLHASDDGSIWFGSLKGLTRNKGETKVGVGEFEYFLRDERVYCVYEFGNEMWAGTEHGIFVATGDAWRNYTAIDGLAGDQVLSMAQEADGSVWIGTDKGLSHFQNGIFE